MSRSTDEVKNWMHLFRWIVKLIRDDFAIEEAKLVRQAQLESELGLSIEQIEQVLEIVADSFLIRFPDDVLDEVIRLEELCMVAAWLKGLYKRPEFISDGFDQGCRAANPGIA